MDMVPLVGDWDETLGWEQAAIVSPLKHRTQWDPLTWQINTPYHLVAVMQPFCYLPTTNKIEEEYAEYADERMKIFRRKTN